MNYPNCLGRWSILRIRVRVRIGMDSVKPRLTDYSLSIPLHRVPAGSSIMKGKRRLGATRTLEYCQDYPKKMLVEAGHCHWDLGPNPRYISDQTATDQWIFKLLTTGAYI